MNQISSSKQNLRETDATHGDALSWARIAGLVQIHPDGSWALTEVGKARMLELEQQAATSGLCSDGPPCAQHDLRLLRRVRPLA